MRFAVEDTMTLTSPTIQSQPTLLYRVVYGSRPALVVTLLLIAVFVIHPVVRAEASTLEESPAAVEVPTVPTEDTISTVDIPLPPAALEEVEPVVTKVEPQPDSEPIPETVVEPDSEPVVSLEIPVEEAADTAVSTGTDPGLDTDVVEEVATSTTDSGDDSSGSPDTATTSSDGMSPPVEVLPVVEDEFNNEPETTNEVATGSEPVVPSATTTLATSTESLPLVHETYSDVEVRFLKRDCVTVDAGAYYCQARSPSGSAKDALIAEPDSGGDLEIFLVKDGEYHQITFNDVDDAAPYYDGRSQTMVWHRLLGDAYVIFEYDFRTGEERALSRGLSNDMEPTRFNDRTVWQRWIDGRWQVILHEDETETQLTTADAHHVAPVIRGEIIMWQTVDETGEKQLETLDLLTGSYHAINDSESAALANPRMMMVYEAVYENGDIITRGVDLKTGEVVALDALPVEVPDEIPESESTGEPRALINAKPSQRDGESESDPEPLPVATGTGTTTDPFTLDLSGSLATTTTVATSTPIIEAGDLFIPPLDTATTVATSTE